MRIDDFLGRSALLHGPRPAISDARRTVTFAELAAEVACVRQWLRSADLHRGDRVAIVAKNSVEYAALYFAAGEIGAVAVPLNWRLRASELESLLRRSDAIAVFAGPEFSGPLTAMRAQLPAIRRWVAVEHSAPGWQDWPLAPVPAPAPARTEEAPDDEDGGVAVQMYTSGTSGAARGAMLTHANLRSMVWSWLLEAPLRSGSHRFLQVTPLFHVGGLLMLLSTIAAGVHMELHAEFSPGPALEALTAHGITHALLVPAMLQWVLAEPGARDATFPHLELIIYGAAPMPSPLLTDALRTFGCSFLQGYGLTETSGVLTVLRPEDHEWSAGAPAPARLASAGRRTHGCDVRVVRTDNQPVAPGEVGEVVARGDTLMAGYYGEQQATLAAYRGGWFRTGDLATVDAEGFVYIVDREKDMIIVGGENVYPQEIETVLRHHAAVSDAAVVGIPHPTWGEEVLAFVALRVGVDTSERDLIQHCRQSLARFKCPTKVEFRPQLPRNAAGKLLKRELRAPYWSGQGRQV